jgi:hypothetical protein
VTGMDEVIPRDIPAWLRSLVEDTDRMVVSDALEEAADEIERLRSALAAQQDGAAVDQRMLDDMKLAANVRDAAIEECAIIAETYKADDPESVRMISYRIEIAKRIRALSGHEQ